MAYEPFQMPYRITGDEDLSTLARKINAIMEGLTFYVNQLQVYENNIGVPTNELVDANKDSWSSVATNFDARNDRISTVPANPVIATDGSAVDHVINTDGSVDISIEWSFNGSGDAYNIDGFIVWLRPGTTSDAYVMGTNPAEEIDYYVGAEKRAIIFQGKPANKYYTIGVQAYRMVDQDINVDGILKSAIIQPAAAGENPYRPSTNVAFAGDVTGTVAGVPGDRIARTGGTLIVGDTSTSLNVKRADYAVPAGSTSAQTTIQQAINALGVSGGKIVLLEGTYIINNSIIIPSNVSLEGQGIGNTVIKLKDMAVNGNAISAYLFKNSDQVNGNTSIQFTNLTIDGNKSSNGNTMEFAFHLLKVTNLSISNVEIKNCLGAGAHIENCSGLNVVSCLIKVCGHVTLGQGAGLYIVNCGDIDLNGCYAQSNALYGLKMLTCNNVTFKGGVFSENGYYGICLLSVSKSDFKGSNVSKNGRHGIYLSDCSGNSINGALVDSNSQETHNTYDNIHITGNSDVNNIQANTCRRGTLAKQPRYGIRVNTSYCNNNMITNNDLYTSGATASLSDAGTGTVTMAGNRL